MTTREHDVPQAGTLDQISYCRRCGAPFHAVDPCTGYDPDHAHAFAMRLTPIDRACLRIVADWHRGEGNPPALLADALTPLCRREGIGWAPTDAVLAVAAALDRIEAGA